MRILRPTSLAIIFLATLFIVGCSNKEKNALLSDNQSSDEIQALIDSSKIRSLAKEVRISYVYKADVLVENLSYDSLLISYKFKVALAYYSLDKKAFRDASEKIMYLANGLNDTASVARSTSFLGNYYWDVHKVDSAYYYFYEAEKKYALIKDDTNTGRMLLNMAIIQKNEKDYIGSENTTIRAISYFEPLEDNKRLASLYNNLAIISQELEQYDEAIENHKKALEYKNKLKGTKANKKLREAYTYNNIGVVYESQEKFDEAIEVYVDILKNEDIIKTDPDFYAKVIDNFAYAKFMTGQKEELPGMFFKSLRIRDSINDVPGLIINHYHLAQYYANRDSVEEAKMHANRSRELALSSNNHGDLLKPLLLLSKLEEGAKGVAYAQQHIRISDSLLKQERSIQNKFARIQFRTEQITQEKEQLAKQKWWIMAISGVLLFSGFLLFVIRAQREKNKELLYEQQQQKANEDIYNLMLAQHEKLEEGRQQEKHRISEELHDGVLGRLFGTRLNLDSLNRMQDEKSVDTRSQYIDQLKDIETEIRQISHDLNLDYLSESSYIAMVEDLVKTQNNITEHEIYLNADEEIDWDDISNKIKINSYRIIQEAIHNINKYAKAKNAYIEIRKKEGTLLLSISDDGIGFNVNAKKSGIGLKNMRSRTRELNGKLDISSQKGEGTQINIAIPH